MPPNRTAVRPKRSSLHPHRRTVRPNGTSAASAPPRKRDRYVDSLRAFAIVRVFFYHALGYTSAALSASFSLLFPSMGVMFALGGSLMAASLDRRPPVRTVLRRLRRLLPALWALGAVVVPTMLAEGWHPGAGHPTGWGQLGYWLLPVLNPPGSGWGNEVLWYLRAYLWFVVLSPVLLPALRRWPVPTLLLPAVVLAADWNGLLGVSGRLGDAVTEKM